MASPTPTDRTLAPTVFPARSRRGWAGADGGSPQVVDAPEFLRRHVHVESEQDVRLEPADTLDHQGRDVPIATVLPQQGGRMKQAGYHVAGDQDRAQRGDAA